MKVCARTACGVALNRGHWKIWNLGTNEPRVYCPKCGRNIIEYNKSSSDAQLKYEKVEKEP